MSEWDYNKREVLIREDGEFRPASPVEIISEITRLRTLLERAKEGVELTLDKSWSFHDQRHWSQLLADIDEVLR